MSEGEWIKEQLSNHIQSTVASGDFATTGTVTQFPLPNIVVDSVGEVRLPLNGPDAASLVNVARQAPFGIDGQTVVDTTYRKTWEISGDAVHFHNPYWQEFLDGIVAKAADALGMPRGRGTVRAELYKMLIYSAGGMFKEHQEYVPNIALRIAS